MVCIASLPCLIKFNLYNGAKDKNLPNIEFILNGSTRGRDLYDYVQECGQIQPDSFKLYLLSSEVMVSIYVLLIMFINKSNFLFMYK